MSASLMRMQSTISALTLLDESPIVCELCGAKQPQPKAFVLDCAHRICTDCLQKHVNAALTDVDCREISCPLAGRAPSVPFNPKRAISRHDDDNDDDDDNNNTGAVGGVVVKSSNANGTTFAAADDDDDMVSANDASCDGDRHATKHRHRYRRSSPPPLPPHSSANDDRHDSDHHLQCVIPHWALRQLTTEARFDELLNASLRALVSADNNDGHGDGGGKFFKCPSATCGAVMERIVDKTSSTTTTTTSTPTTLTVKATASTTSSTSSTSTLSAAEIEEVRSQHRFRCRACGHDFCANCATMPYHDRHTCASWRALIAGKRCRFCADAVAPATFAANAIAQPAALQAVCASAACVALRDKSCTELLPCSHPCSGIRGEVPAYALRAAR
jgi:hypothetical protein